MVDLSSKQNVIGARVTDKEDERMVHPEAERVRANPGDRHDRTDGGGLGTLLVHFDDGLVNDSAHAQICASVNSRKVCVRSEDPANAQGLKGFLQFVAGLQLESVG